MRPLEKRSGSKMSSELRAVWEVKLGYKRSSYPQPTGFLTLKLFVRRSLLKQKLPPNTSTDEEIIKVMLLD